MGQFQSSPRTANVNFGDRRRSRRKNSRRNARSSRSNSYSSVKGSPKKNYKGFHLVKITRSEKPGKKMKAVFLNSKTGRTRTTHFGASGMSDYTKHKDRERKERYIRRHRKKENWRDPLTAGSLSRWILWNKPSLKASIADYKKKFFK